KTTRRFRPSTLFFCRYYPVARWAALIDRLQHEARVFYRIGGSRSCRRAPRSSVRFPFCAGRNFGESGSSPEDRLGRLGGMCGVESASKAIPVFRDDGKLLF